MHRCKCFDLSYYNDICVWFLGFHGLCWQGYDIAKGDVVLKSRDRLGLVEIGLLATVGVVKVKVFLIVLCWSVFLSCLSLVLPLWMFCSEAESFISSTKLQVYPTPKIAVLSTGDEVVEPTVQFLNRG